MGKKAHKLTLEEAYKRIAKDWTQHQNFVDYLLFEVHTFNVILMQGFVKCSFTSKKRKASTEIQRPLHPLALQCHSLSKCPAMSQPVKVPTQCPKNSQLTASAESLALEHTGPS